VLVVDASAFSSWAFAPEGSDRVSQALIRVMTEEDRATSTALFPVEALHAAEIALECGRFSPAAHQHVLRLLARLPVALAPMRLSPLEFWSWARPLGLPPQAATYLRLALDLQAPLVTMDPPLLQACRQLGHPVITDLS
jgi:predicted nucleic acid-binding protein